MIRQTRLVQLAVVATAVLIFVPATHADAATSGSSNTGLVLGAGGGVSISGLTANNLTGTFATGSVSGAIDSGTWADTSGTGAGWHGSMQLTSGFAFQTVWTQTTGTNTLLSSTSSGTWTGTVGAAGVTVTVASGPTITTTPVTYSDREGSATTSSSATCTNGTPCTLSSGVTITFAAATAYPVGAVYSMKAGLLPTSSSLTTASGSGTIVAAGTTAGGSNLPAFENTGTPVTTASAVNFVTAALNTGMGSFTISPGVTISWDPNNAWAGETYTATVQYAITVGP